MSQFDDTFNYGLSVASGYLQEPFTYKGKTYLGIFNGLRKGSIHVPGGEKKILSDTLVVSTSVLPNRPDKGEFIVKKDGTVLEVWLVQINDDLMYDITLTEKSK